MYKNIQQEKIIQHNTSLCPKRGNIVCVSLAVFNCPPASGTHSHFNGVPGEPASHQRQHLNEPGPSPAFTSTDDANATALNSSGAPNCAKLYFLTSPLVTQKWLPLSQ